MKKRSKRQSGQSLVEFALMLPILILVLCGIIDFGWLFTNQLMIEFGARDGARYAAINARTTDLATLQTNVTSRVKSNTVVKSPDSITVTTTYTSASGEVSVHVEYPLTFFTPVLSTAMPNYKVKSTCAMKAE